MFGWGDHFTALSHLSGLFQLLGNLFGGIFG